MEIDGWEVDQGSLLAHRGAYAAGGPVAGESHPCLVVSMLGRAVYLPVRVARILLGDEPREPCPDCGTREASAEESSEIIRELVADIAALTGTALTPRSCGGHPSPEAHAQIKAAQAGRTAEGALPWRPEIGGECYFYCGANIQEWHRVRRLDDDAGYHRFDALTEEVQPFFCRPAYDGIRPLGSLPVPASVRAKAEE